MTERIALVIGGGIAGPAVALFLKRAGFVPVVFEAHEQRSDIGGGLQIAPNGMHVLCQLGLAKKLLERGIESAELCFENQFGKALGCIPNGPAARYKNPAIQISRSVLHEALLDELRRNQISIHYSKRLQEIATQGQDVVARFTDESTALGTILVGADGIHSRTRQIVFPQTPAPSYTGLVTLGGFARHETLRPKDASHHTRAHMIFGLEAFFGYGYYDSADPCAVMWWSHQQRKELAAAEELWPQDTKRLQAQLLDRHRGWTTPVEQILQNTFRLLCGPVHDLAVPALWSRDRVVLIGDAAHAISPHAGLGASLALEDALSLAKQLRGNDFAQAFHIYQRERRPRAMKIAAEARKRGESKHAITPAAARIRDLVISAFLRFRGAHLNDYAYQFEENWE